jgi:hypothetical protein
MRSHARRAFPAALLLAAITVTVGPLSPAGAGPVAKRDTSGLVYEPGQLPAGRPGYFQVTTDDGQTLPVYWLPAGFADSAPAEIRDTAVYRADMNDPLADDYDLIIYGKGVAVAVPATARTKRTSAADCWAGWSCLFDGQNYSGRILRFADAGTWQNMASYSFNNDARALYDHKDNKATLYAADPDGGGPTPMCNHAGEADATLGASWDQNISSIKIRDANSC